MKEIKLLDKTLRLIDEKGTSEAYQYLVSNLDENDILSSQVYNFLYCLAASSGKKKESINWLKEAIYDKGMWYRPKVFQDKDLDLIRDTKAFRSCLGLSNKRYKDTLKKSSTVCTLDKKKEDSLILVLHGNQQNNEISKRFWSEVKIKNFQIEYLQSSEIDSYQLYRWNDNGSGPKQLKNTLRLLDKKEYNNIIITGFSSGCNTILRGILEEDIYLDKVILFSPWIPIIRKKAIEIIEVLKKTKMEVNIICGENDKDCLSLCKNFEAKANQLNFNLNFLYIKNLGHEYPNNIEKILKVVLT